MERYSCDFETTTGDFYKKYGYTRVWCACAINIDNTDDRLIFNSIDEFIDYFVNKPATLYFHNLRFDGEFINSYLLNNGWEYDEELSHNKTFRATISDVGVWYMLELCIKRYKSRVFKITIYDSLKKLPFRVSQISKAFNIEEQKLEIDYDLERPEGYVLTQEEKDYIVNDCLIVAKALKIQFEQGLDKMTIGADALNYYKGGMSKKDFKYFFPVLNLETDNYIRRAYKGGWTFCNERYANQIHKGVSFDVNSLYPSVMYGNNGLLPYGVPKFYTGEYKKDDRYPLYICRVLVDFKLKPNKFPSIQLKGYSRFVDTEYLKSSDGPVELTLTNPDLELLFECYDVDFIRYLDGYKFRATDKLFKSYIDHFMEMKMNNTGALRTLAKLYLNNLYGKFSKNPKMQGKSISMGEDGIVKYDLEEAEYVDSVYTAMGAFITAYGRKQTITSANAVYDRFLYADTDSIHLIGTDIPEGLKVDDKLLGYWKCEGVFDEGKFIRAKTYIKFKHGEIDVTCAGMPDNLKEQLKKMTKEEAFNIFEGGAVFEGKLMPKRVKGGVVLTPTTFTIK